MIKSVRDPFWGGYKEIIRRYRNRDGTEAHDLRERERLAVEAAVKETEGLPSGEQRIKLIELVFWAQTHRLTGAAVQCFVSEKTATRWHTEFIKKVAENLWEN